jgi:hypothetical protein
MCRCRSSAKHHACHYHNPPSAFLSLKAFIITFSSHPQAAPSCFTPSHVSPFALTPCPPPLPSLVLRGPGPPPSPTRRETRMSPQRANCRWTRIKIWIKTRIWAPTNTCSLTRRCIQIRPLLLLLYLPLYLPPLPSAPPPQRTLSPRAPFPTHPPPCLVLSCFFRVYP